jgi:hypothetical protein
MILDRPLLHDLSAKLDYKFDWTPWLTELGDTIDTFTLTAQTGLTIVSSSDDNYVVTAWVTIDSSVPLNKLLTLACKIVTVGGREDERTITLKAAQR